MTKEKMSIEQAIRLLHPETTAEAIAEIKYYGGFHGRTACIDALYEASLVACEAMDKQIPKKPEKVAEDTLLCPACSGFLGYEGKCKEEPYRLPYCSGCGQAILWESD